MMRSLLLTTAISLAVSYGYASAVADCSQEIEAMEAFLIRQMEWFDDHPIPPRPPEQPPLKQTFGWDTSLLFPPWELSPPLCCSDHCAPPPPSEMCWRGDIYDQSLDAVWFTERGRLDFVNGRDPSENLERARRLLDAGLFLQDHDPIGDGRLRAAYWANNLLNPAATESSIMDPDAATGNNAWFGIALTRFYDTATLAGYLDAGTRQAYLDAARVMGQWILDHCSSSACCGFTGGYGGWTQTPFTWKSTEHNIDVWTLAQNLYGLTGEAKWAAMASSAACLVQSMYVDVDPNTGYYRTGTLADGCTPNPSPIPADAQAWTALARRGPVAIDCDDRARKAMRWLLDNLKDACECVGLPANGVKFSDVGKNMQCEVTASSAFALFWLGCETAEAQIFIDLLAWIRVNAAPSYDGITGGIGLVATPCPEGAWTGWADAWYFKLLHSASSDWYGFTCLYVHEAEDWANPFAPLANQAAPPADFDRDGDVDSVDFDWFESCASGPAIPHDGSEICQIADFDEDSDVDQADFAIFQRCYSGPDAPADPSCAAPPPLAMAWRSVGSHGSAGALAIELDPTRTGNGSAGPTVECRTCGMRRFEVDFEQPVTLANLAAVTVTDSLGGAYTPSAVSMADPDTLVLSFEPSLLPDERRYRIDLNACVQNVVCLPLAGDTDCWVRALVGDVNGDGLVDLNDVAPLEVAQGQIVDVSSLRKDVDCSGDITLIDAALVRSKIGRSVTCP